MSVREYIGARYVPVFAEPVEWDSTRAYEPLTVVLYRGDSYTTKQATPAGIDISNETYWAHTGNYNAQIEQYRSEVRAYDKRITDNANNIAANKRDADDKIESLTTEHDDDIATVNSAITAANNNIKNLSTKHDADIATVNNTIAANKTASDNKDAELEKSITDNKTISDNKDAELEQSIADNKAATDNAITKIQTDFKNKFPITIDQLAKGKMFIIGDSWCDFDGKANPEYRYPNWAEAVAAHVNCNYKSYGYGGAGFLNTNGGNNFTVQVNQAIKDYPNDDVSYIIVMGGTNDVNNGYTNSATITAINSLVQTINSNWPSAKVILMVGQPIAPYDYGSSSMSAYTRNLSLKNAFNVNYIKGNLNAVNITSQFSAFGNLQPSTYLQANGYHVNDTVGKNILSKIIMGCIDGIEYHGMVNVSQSISVSDGGSTVNLTIGTYDNHIINSGGTNSYVEFASGQAGPNTTIIGLQYGDSWKMAPFSRMIHDKILLPLFDGNGIYGGWISIEKSPKENNSANVDEIVIRTKYSGSGNYGQEFIPYFDITTN